MKNLITFLILFLTLNFCSAQTDLIGQLGKKLGTTLTVAGTLIEGPHKGYESGPNLMVQMIEGSVNQRVIQIPISTEYGKFGDQQLPKLNNGATYMFRAYETGAFVGIPADAREEAKLIVQAPEFYFRNELVVISGKEVNPIENSPAEFIGRNALLSGVARNEKGISVIEGSNWKLRLTGFREWTKSEIGKSAEVYGNVRMSETKDIYNVENGRARLVRLEDQVGKMVNLRGRAISRNGHWWFNYRGVDIYVEKMKELPNWTTDNHFRAMEISGVLELEELPRIDQISIKEDRDRKLYYIVRQASWSPIDELLIPELK